MKQKYWTLSVAIEQAKKLGVEVSKPTLVKWIRNYKIGFQLGGEGGKWYVFPEKFMRYVNGGKIPQDNITEPENGRIGTSDQSNETSS
jgi:hypothetical protein